MFNRHSEAEFWKRSTCKQNILFRKRIPPQQFLQSLLKWFRLWWQRAVMRLYVSPQRDFFFIAGLKYFNMKYHTFESTLGCFIMHTALHTACSSGISWHIYIYKKKILTHLVGVWNCSSIFIPVLFPFTLTLMRMKNTITPLYCAAFIVDCFMSVEIHFLLNLSSFTQGHTLLCISIPRLFKTQACLSLWLLTWPKMWYE